MSREKVLILKIGNTNLAYSLIDNDKINICSINDFLANIEKNISIFQKYQKIYICSTNKPIVKILKQNIKSELIINPFLKKEKLDYSKLEKKQLGTDLYYALEFLAEKQKDFDFISLGTYSVFIKVCNFKIDLIKIYLSTTLELTNIGFEFLNIESSNKEINNWKIVKECLIMPKIRQLENYLTKNPFISGNEAHYFYDLTLNKKFIAEIEIKALKHFINKSQI